MSGALTLGAANALALAGAVGATALYARALEPAFFGHWAVALAVARAGLVLLDGGLKTTLVRSSFEADAITLRRLAGWCTLAAVLLCGLFAAGLAGALRWSSLGADAALLLGAYAAAYWLSYPPLLPALARLERAERFGVIGRAEGASVMVEFVLPAVLMAAGVAPVWSFVVAVVAARRGRTAWLWHGERALRHGMAATAPARGSDGNPRWLRDGLGVQAICALSMLRDQLHLWLLAPAFGAAAAGHYALALTACALASQVAVATVSRMLLPRLVAMEPAARWPLVLSTTRVLAMLALPALALVPAWLAWLDAQWWDSRWALAIAVAPWLALRMVGGVATTVVGGWLMAARSPWHGAAAHARWSLFEVAVAAAALAIGGPVVMAAAMALSVWFGLWWLLRAAQPEVPVAARLHELVLAVCARPSLAGALALAAWVHQVPAALPAATLALPLVALLEAPVRRWLRVRWLRAPRAGGVGA